MHAGCYRPHIFSPSVYYELTRYFAFSTLDALIALPPDFIFIPPCGIRLFSGRCPLAYTHIKLIARFPLGRRIAKDARRLSAAVPYTTASERHNIYISPFIYTPEEGALVISGRPIVSAVAQLISEIAVYYRPTSPFIIIPRYSILLFCRVAVPQ